MVLFVLEIQLLDQVHRKSDRMMLGPEIDRDNTTFLNIQELIKLRLRLNQSDRVKPSDL